MIRYVATFRLSGVANAVNDTSIASATFQSLATMTLYASYANVSHMLVLLYQSGNVYQYGNRNDHN